MLSTESWVLMLHSRQGQGQVMITLKSDNFFFSVQILPKRNSGAGQKVHAHLLVVIFILVSNCPGLTCVQNQGGHEICYFTWILSEMQNDGILASLFNISENSFGNQQRQATSRKWPACADNLNIGKKKEDGDLFGSTTSPLPCWRDFSEKFEKWNSSIVHLSCCQSGQLWQHWQRSNKR